MLHAKKSGIKTIPGDIFEAGPAPSETVTNHLHFPQQRIVLVHACNTVGSWGAGIALAFKDRYPEQYELYRQWCLDHRNPNIPNNPYDRRRVPSGGRGRASRTSRGEHDGKVQDNRSIQRRSLVGTCLLIPPPSTSPSSPESISKPGIYIACLFTSKAYGRNKDSPEEILSATRRALVDLTRQLHQGVNFHGIRNTGHVSQSQTESYEPDGWELHACRFNSGKFGVPWDHTAAIIEELGIEMTVHVPLGEM
ncbi:hypothetical protein C8J55DRAFT_510142 [Lentinula edodes]|uniref:ADP-ribose 1''-phosphate phosphatase n=1 Tax=Lentinula lateritia TaxID=40482 RepID=A0A9W9AL02_9AGAR|nr:hypothetical protein C8J55DRAFT_510142 [Lentinula edodes]